MLPLDWAAGSSWKLAIAASLLLLGACSRPADPSAYSVVLVTLDTTRADRIGAFGGAAVPTPRLDEMAREGVIFEQAVSQVPLTLPAHSSILTGLYPHDHGVLHNGIFRLPEQARTLAEHLKGQGFATAAVVGAFVLNEEYGTAQGFDLYEDIETDRYQGGQDSQYEAQRTAEQVNARVFEWLDKRPAGRFFLWVHYYDPHLPYAPPESPGKPLQGSGYDREISYVDGCFGDLIARLRSEGVLDQALLAVVGDHGESLGEHLELSHGVFLYEGVVRVPFFIRAPGIVPEGASVRHPVELVDVAPTLLDLLKLDPLPGVKGKSLARRIRGEEDGTGAVAYAETHFPRLEFGWSDIAMVRSSRFKYVGAPRPELYDLRADPQEVRNLVAIEPERAAEMASLLADWKGQAAGGSVAASAGKSLSPDEEARLRSLGYLGGAGSAAPAGGALPDPKDMVEEGRLITKARDLSRQGKVVDALAILDRIVATSPNNHSARSARVQSLIRAGRVAAAEEEALAFLAAAASDPYATPALMEKARRVLASVLWMNGKNEEAEREYRLAIELNQRTASAPVFPGLLLGAAGGREEASRIVQDVLARNPRDPMAWAAKFELEYAAKSFPEALRTAERLAAMKAGDVDTLTKAGVLAREAGNTGLAVGLFAAATEKEPANPDLLGHLATALIAAGDLNAAELRLNDVRRIRPRDPRAPFYLGNIALLRGREQEARRFFARALELDPTSVAPLLNLARWLAEHRRFDDSRKALEEAEARKPGSASTAELRRQIESLSASPIR